MSHDVKTIAGRWQGAGAEWTVTVGFRVENVALRDERPAGSVTRLDEREVEVTYDSYIHVSVSHANFFRYFRPAPPASRWLDPASVPVGACAMPQCFRAHTNQSLTCAFPARDGVESRCYACRERESRTPAKYYGTPMLPPSGLTPAPRWRLLLGTKWSCGKPERVSRVIDVTGDPDKPARYAISRRVIARPTGGVVYKVRAPSLNPGTPYPRFDVAVWQASP